MVHGIFSVGFLRSLYFFFAFLSLGSAYYRHDILLAMLLGTAMNEGVRGTWHILIFRV